jgi:glyoxylase I family protein
MAFIVQNLIPLLEVFDLPVSIAFYRDVLGFEVVSGDDSWWAMLQLGGAKLMLNTAYDDDERPPAPEPARVKGHADTSLYFSSDPDAVYAHLRARGLNVKEPSVTSYGMRQVSTTDPDGFQLFFIAPAESK